uniref:Uncharacterized protein n=1 Tax=Lotus japonicus TaxID=34305 RepID=I3S3G9_LOTJA|nr:unknown [Lotus japonicus]
MHSVRVLVESFSNNHYAPGPPRVTSHHESTDGRLGLFSSILKLHSLF